MGTHLRKVVIIIGDSRYINTSVNREVRSSYFCNRTLAIHILNLLEEGHCPASIARVLNKSKTTIQHYIGKMKAYNWIFKISNYPQAFEVTEKGKEEVRKMSLRVKLTRIEHFQIKIPILRDNSNATFDYERDATNWVRKYWEKGFPFDMTVEKTTKSFIIHVKQKEFYADKSFFGEFTNYAWKIVQYVAQFVRSKGFEIDPLQARVISQEIETQLPEYDKHLSVNGKKTIKLKRNAISPLGKMNVEAKAWLDKSRGVLELGTNDTNYQENFILMPENVVKLEHDVKRQLSTMNHFMEISYNQYITQNNFLGFINKKIDKLNGNGNEKE